MANYDNNIVNGPDLLSQSQPDMLSNFKAIDDLINVNHIGFNDPDQGKHKWVTFPRATNIPFPGIGAGLMFAPLNRFTNDTELRYARQDGTETLFTAHDIPFNQPSWSDFAGSAIILKTMRVSAFRGAQEIDFPTGPGIPQFRTALAVQASIDGQPRRSGINASVYIENFGSTSISLLVFSNVANNNDRFGVFIMAIGVI